MQRMKKTKKALVLMIFAGVFVCMSACGPKTNENPGVDSTKTSLKVIKGTPNPKGHVEDLYLFKGEVSTDSISIDQSETKLPNASTDGKASKLAVFHFNDMHGNIVKYDQKGDTHTLSQMVKKVSDYSNANPNDAVLFVSAGDDHIGSTFDELLGNTPEEFIKSAPYTAYSAGGLDFSVIGNHELDKQSEIFKKSVEKDAKFSVLSSNIVGSQFDIPYYPAAIAVVKGLRIGVVGVTNPKEVSLHTPTDKNLSATDPLESISGLLPAMEPYCDAFVVISHNGYDKSTDRYTLNFGDSSIAEKIATLTKLPSVVVGGHTHTILNEKGLEDTNVFSGVPVLQAGEHGKYLGEFIMSFKDGGKADYSALLHPILPGTSKDPTAKLETSSDYDTNFQVSVIDPIKQELDKKLKQVFSKTGNTELVTDEVTDNDRYIGESAMANFFNDAIVKQSANMQSGQVDLAMINATGLSGLNRNSDITYGDMYQLMPYADTLSYVTVTGKDIKDIVTNNALRINKKEDMIPFGGNLDPAAFIEHGFMHFSSGIRYTIVLGNTSDKNAVEDLTINGEPVDNVLDKEYTILISTYTANGRGGWKGEPIGQGLPDNVIGYDIPTLVKKKGYDTSIVYRNELIDYIKKNKVIDESTGLVKDGRLLVK